MSTQTTPSGAERRVRSRAGPTGRLGDALFRVLRWIGGHVRGFHTAVGTFLIIAVLLVVIGAVGFATLAQGVVRNHDNVLDRSVMEWMGRSESSFLTKAALEVTALGAGVVVWMLVLVSSVFLWVSRHRYSVLLLWVSILGAGLISSTLKAFFNRPRPDIFPWRAPYADQASFPSGHSMTAMVAYSTLAFLIARLEPTPFLRRMTFVLAGVVIVLIGLSRMYLGVHWPSDVIGGFLTGIAWAAFCALGIDALRYFRTRKPEIEEVEEDLDAEAEREAGVRE
jgi:undecaprenyl-diphosphatase